MLCFTNVSRWKPTQWSSYLNTARKRQEKCTSSDAQSTLSEKSDPTSIQCTKCGLTKPASEFYQDNSRRSGKSRKMTCCRTCNLQSGRSKRLAAKKHFGSGFNRKLSQERPPEGTPCQVCNRPMVYHRSARLMCFDHDPNTHEFRGWICQNCNTAIGKLGDNLAGLMAAVNYLYTRQWITH